MTLGLKKVQKTFTNFKCSFGDIIMTLVTKDSRQYDCKFVLFELDGEHEGEVKIVLWDDSGVYEELNNVFYVNA